MFGDNTCRITSSSNGIANLVNYKEWNFETRTSVGVLADDLMLGGGGAYINIKIYP
jgi:hypothetical protein